MFFLLVSFLSYDTKCPYLSPEKVLACFFSYELTPPQHSFSFNKKWVLGYTSLPFLTFPKRWAQFILFHVPFLRCCHCLDADVFHINKWRLSNHEPNAYKNYLWGAYSSLCLGNSFATSASIYLSKSGPQVMYYFPYENSSYW